VIPAAPTVPRLPVARQPESVELGNYDYPRLSQIQGGQFRRFITRWASLTAPTEILQVVSGYSIPFVRKPPLAPLTTAAVSRFATHSSPDMDFSIVTMLILAIAQQTAADTGFLSRLFLVSKPDGSKRPIFNLKCLNAFLRPKRFRLKCPFGVPRFLQPNDEN